MAMIFKDLVALIQHSCLELPSSVDDTLFVEPVV